MALNSAHMDATALAILERHRQGTAVLASMLPKLPRFRLGREVSARRARKLRKRGEYLHFVRWTANGKCRYTWGGPVPTTFKFRFPARSLSQSEKQT